MELVEKIYNNSTEETVAKLFLNPNFVVSPTININKDRAKRLVSTASEAIATYYHASFEPSEKILTKALASESTSAFSDFLNEEQKFGPLF